MDRLIDEDYSIEDIVESSMMVSGIRHLKRYQHKTKSNLLDVTNRGRTR